MNTPRPPGRLGQAVPAAPPRPEAVAICHFTKEVIATRQMRYGDYAISTSRLAEGSWIASFGCPDGRFICADGKGPAASVTERYSAETLAIADAQLRIQTLEGGRQVNPK